MDELYEKTMEQIYSKDEIGGYAILYDREQLETVMAISKYDARKIMPSRSDRDGIFIHCYKCDDFMDACLEGWICTHCGTLITEEEVMKKFPQLRK